MGTHAQVPHSQGHKSRDIEVDAGSTYRDRIVLLSRHNASNTGKKSEKVYVAKSEAVMTGTQLSSNQIFLLNAARD